MVGKKQKNIILVVLASIALALLSLATCLCVSSTRAVHADADVDVGDLIGETQEYKTVYVGEKMMYLYDLKVGDSIYGKTLVCPASINQKFSSTVVLSDGNVIAYNDSDPLLFGPDENTLLWWFEGAKYGDETTFYYSPFDIAEQDYLFSAQIDNSNIKSSESEERSISEDATVVSVTNKCSSIGIMYAVEEPIEVEKEDNTELDTEKETGNSEAKEKWYDRVSVWLEENTGVAISGSAIGTIVVLIVVYNVFFKKRR